MSLTGINGITKSLCLHVFDYLPLFIFQLPHNDPHYFALLVFPVCFFPSSSHTQGDYLHIDFFASPLELRRCCVATWQASDCQGLYCGFTAYWPPAQPHTHTKSHTHTWPTHSCSRREGGLAGRCTHLLELAVLT